MNFDKNIFSDLYDQAYRIEALEDGIFLDKEDINLVVAHRIQQEIETSNAIEGIRMDSFRIRSAIAESMGHINDAWIPAAQEDRKEELAVRSAIQFLANGEHLSNSDILDAHRMLSREEGWGCYRDHPESVYDENDVSVYDAPPEEQVVPLMDTFIDWWNTGRKSFPCPIGSALAHLIYLTIHPFKDGNGRIGRMIADKAQIRHGRNFRLWSMSAQINAKKGKYYELLNAAQLKDQIIPYVRYMLDIHESAVRIAASQAVNICAAKEFMAKTPMVFSHAEKTIIFEMAAGNKDYWTFFEATKYMEDGDEAQSAWENLENQEIIRNGKLNLTFPQQIKPIC